MGHLSWTLISSQTLDVTPPLIAEFCGIPASATERDLSPKRVKYLERALLDGTAISFNWARATVGDTGEVIRINGQHSSSMLASLNGNIPEGLKVHLDDYKVESKESLGLLFRQFDSRWSTRSINDISGVYQGLEPELIDVPKKTGRLALEGAVWFKRKIVGEYVPLGDDRFTLFNHKDLHPFIQMTGRICSVKTPEFTTPAMGAMYGTWDREPTIAEEFWSSVAKQGSDADGDPATTLDAWLVAAKDADQTLSQWEIYRACAVAWNAFRNRRPLEKISRYVAGKGTPDLE